MRQRSEKLILSTVSIAQSLLSLDLLGNIDRCTGNMATPAANHTEFMR